MREPIQSSARLIELRALISTATTALEAALDGDEARSPDLPRLTETASAAEVNGVIARLC